jgi:hypothetical protein
VPTGLITPQGNIKMDSKLVWYEFMVCLGIGPLPASCEHVNQTFGAIEGGELVMQRSCYERLSSMWSDLERVSLQVCPRTSHCALRIIKPTALPIPVAARSKTWVCGCSLAGIVGSNPAGGIYVCLL